MRHARLARPFAALVLALLTGCTSARTPPASGGPRSAPQPAAEPGYAQAPSDRGEPQEPSIGGEARPSDNGEAPAPWAGKDEGSPDETEGAPPPRAAAPPAPQPAPAAPPRATSRSDGPMGDAPRGGSGAAAEASPRDAWGMPTPTPGRGRVAETKKPTPGIGTSWGETRSSHVDMVSFERESDDPLAMLSLRYDAAEGARALAERHGWPTRTTALVRRGGLEVSLRDEYGAPLPAWSAGGHVIAIGEIGRRYALRIVNQTPGRVEAVASVDGLDVLDGKPAAPDKRGYLVGPWSTLQIDGFRRSTEAVAAFRFGATDQSYASRTGHPRDVGVIGVAFFDERGSRRRWSYDPAEVDRRDSADPFPGRFAQPPR